MNKAGILTQRSGALLANLPRLQPWHKMLSMNRSDSLRKRRDEILRIAKCHGVEDLRLFGSVSRGEERPDSDIDFLVRLESGRSLLDIVAFKQDIEDLLGFKIDVVTENAVSPYIRERVLKEALSL